MVQGTTSGSTVSRLLVIYRTAGLVTDTIARYFPSTRDGGQTGEKRMDQNLGVRFMQLSPLFQILPEVR